MANAGIERALASKEEEAASLADQLRDERALIQSLQQRLAAFQRRSLEDSSDTESSDSGRAAESGRAPHQELRQLREAKQRAEQEMAALRSFLEQTQEDNRMRGELIENLQNHIAELKGALDDERAALKEKSAREGDRYRDELESLKGQLLAAEAQLVTANASRNDAILYADRLGAVTRSCATRARRPSARPGGLPPARARWRPKSGTCLLWSARRSSTRRSSFVSMTGSVRPAELWKGRPPSTKTR